MVEEMASEKACSWERQAWKKGEDLMRRDL